MTTLNQIHRQIQKDRRVHDMPLREYTPLDVVSGDNRKARRLKAELEHAAAKYAQQ